jgi:hypothetical protein
VIKRDEASHIFAVCGPLGRFIDLNGLDPSVSALKSAIWRAIAGGITRYSVDKGPISAELSAEFPDLRAFGKSQKSRAGISELFLGNVTAQSVTGRDEASQTSHACAI